MYGEEITATSASQVSRLRKLSSGKFETDSRNIQTGDIFVCRQGLTRDSHDFFEDAIKRGASGLITTRKLDTDIPSIETPGFSASVNLISEYYQHPQDSLFNIGVTGTNGKTTVAYSLKQLIDRKTRAAYTGTLGCQFDNKNGHLVNTTPDAITLLNLMNEMNRRAVTHHVMEVSSHALDQDRVSIINYDVIIFTNLGQDHLDYHGSRDEYVQAKLRLTDRLKPGGTAVINLDDPMAPAIIGRCRGRANIITFGCRNRKADLFASEIHSSCDGGQFILNYQGQTIPIRTPLPFTFNIENSLVILAVLSSIYSLITAVDLLEKLEPVPGRCEVINFQNGASAIIDYAHNRDSLESLLRNARQHTRGKISMVVGVTGDRLLDAESIGEVCSRLSDEVYFTNDNPLGFEPESIVHAMSRRADPSRYLIELDRCVAIQKAMAKLNSGDLLLVCGKGYEEYEYMGSDKGNPVPYIGDSEAIQAAARQYGLNNW